MLHFWVLVLAFGSLMRSFICSCQIFRLLAWVLVLLLRKLSSLVETPSMEVLSGYEAQ